jgi:hypothetical protein
MAESPGRHVFTTEERQLGFRRAIESVQEKYGLDFNEAVQWLLRKSAKQAGYHGDWQAYREARTTAAVGVFAAIIGVVVALVQRDRQPTYQEV